LKLKFTKNKKIKQKGNKMPASETLSQRPEQHDSLSTEKNIEAVDLYKDYMHAQRARYEGRNDRKYHPTYTSGIFAPFYAAIETGRVHNTLRRAKHHYEQNKDAYHAQAVRDAQEEEVEINFSGDTAKKVNDSRED
jgi:hypothetical protein